MKTLYLASLLIVAPAAASAYITPSNPVTSAHGAETAWQYDLQWSASAETAAAWRAFNPRGTAPWDSVPIYFTLQDFSGYIDGSCTGPAGWVCRVRESGKRIDGGHGADITWSFAGGLKYLQAQGDVDMGWFGAQSLFAGASPLGFASGVGDFATPALQGGTRFTGSTLGPQASRGEVPEPGTMALTGLALGLLAWTRGRRAAR